MILKLRNVVLNHKIPCDNATMKQVRQKHAYLMVENNL